jgi:magnesium-transporting ATPase (P-type)
LADCTEAGIRVIMLTGDHPVTALAVAEGLALPHCDADIAPALTWAGPATMSWFARLSAPPSSLAPGPSRSPGSSAPCARGSRWWP